MALEQPYQGPGRIAGNVRGLREVERTIVSAYILTVDDYMLMGRQDPDRGGTWPNVWRILGGGVKEENGETPADAMIREAGEEAIGLDAREHTMIRLPLTAQDAHEKTLGTGEVVWQNMDFLHFAIFLGGTAADFAFAPGDDIIELRYFDRGVRGQIEQVPIGQEMMYRAGFLDRPA